MTWDLFAANAHAIDRRRRQRARSWLRGFWREFRRSMPRLIIDSDGWLP